MILKKIFAVIFTAALLASQARNVFPLGSRHTYHTTLTRINYNAKAKLVEISLQLFTHDLTPTLERRTKTLIDYDKTADIDKLIFDYLNEKFVLKDKNGAVQKLTWVGKEVKTDTVYVYVETETAADLENFNLQNTLFFESFPEQTNLVVVRWNDKKADLLFKAGDKFKELKPAVPKVEN